MLEHEKPLNHRVFERIMLLPSEVIDRITRYKENNPNYESELISNPSKVRTAFFVVSDEDS